jgi:coenzyme F420-reducing hydrogenase delta subunit
MDFLGIDTARVTFSWVSAAEGAKWARLVDDFTDAVRALGPCTEFRELAQAGVDQGETASI